MATRNCDLQLYRDNSMPLYTQSYFTADACCLQQRPEAEAKISAVYNERSLTMLNMLSQLDRVHCCCLRPSQLLYSCGSADTAVPETFVVCMTVVLCFPSVTCVLTSSVMQLRAIMQKKLTTSVEEDASVSEHYNEVCKREARVRQHCLLLSWTATSFASALHCLATFHSTQIVNARSSTVHCPAKHGLLCSVVNSCCHLLTVQQASSIVIQASVTFFGS